jgi:hypothetical protein
MNYAILAIGLMEAGHFKQLMTLTLITLSSFHCISLTFKKLLQGLSNTFSKYKTNNNFKNFPMGPYQKGEGGLNI